MDLIALMPAFVVAVVLISASPGPAMALIVRRSAVHGWQAAVPSVLGVELGLYIWALAAAAGFAALVAVSQTAFLVLKVVGAGVLVWLGVRAWRSACVFYVGLAYVVARAGTTFRSSRVRRRIDAVLARSWSASGCGWR